MQVMYIGLIVAVAFLLLGAIMILVSSLTVGLVCMIVALGGAVLAVVGLILSKKEGQQAPPSLEV